MRTQQTDLDRTQMRRHTAVSTVLIACILSYVCGCTSLTQPINGVPAERLPAQFFPEQKSDLVPVDVSILSIEPPRDYQIGGGDILGVYLEGVLPFNAPNEPPAPPPVNFPEALSTLPPSIGFPIAVQDDGTLSLPLLEPLDVEGLTLDQVRDAIRDSYIAEELLPSNKARPIVTIIRERTYDVIVVREDTMSTQGGSGGYIRGTSDETATGGLVKLPAYQNDILHALVQTGGLPGLNAKNEVKVLRANRADKGKRADFLRRFWRQQEAAKLDPCVCPPTLPDDPSILKIPLRVKPGVVIELSEQDVTLESGDIVYIESRDAEVFYTGGLLNPGEHLLPRDYDLDALGAMAIAGGAVGGNAPGTQNGSGGGGGGSGGGLGRNTSVPPGLLYILRKTPCNGQIAIEVDLAQAINDPKSRPLIQPGDTLILQYKCEEELINFGIATFFTYGIAELFNGR